MKRYLKPIIIIVVVLVADQVFKLLVKNNMHLGEEIKVIGNWFILHFTENKGIAFGFEFAGRNGKLFLTLFRIIAATLIAIFMISLIKKGYPNGFIACVSLIFAGAMGNIIDSVFYGIVFDYEKVFHGRVVDMLYFPIINTNYPDWFPFLGGQRLIFFRPVFNIADTAITTGVLSILVFYNKTLKKL